MNLLKTTVNHFKPYWRKLLVALIFSIIGGLFTIVPPVLVKTLGGRSDCGGDLNFLVWVVGRVLGAYLGKSLFETMQEYVQVKIGLDVITDMQIRAFRKLHRDTDVVLLENPEGRYALPSDP